MATDGDDENDDDVERDVSLSAVVEKDDAEMYANGDKKHYKTNKECEGNDDPGIEAKEGDCGEEGKHDPSSGQDEEDGKVVRGDDSGENPTTTTKRASLGRSARRRRAKARSIVEAEKRLFGSGLSTRLEGCGAVARDGSGAGAGSSSSSSAVPSDREAVLPGTLQRRIEHRRRYRNRRGANTNTAGGSVDDDVGPTPVVVVVGKDDGKDNERDQDNLPPGAEGLDPIDARRLASQLGYIPGNAVSVAARVGNLPDAARVHLARLSAAALSSSYPRGKLTKGAFQVGGDNHDGHHHHDDGDDEPTVLKLYPLAARDAYGGGKTDGRKYKSRRRGGGKKRKRGTDRGGCGNDDAIDENDAAESSSLSNAMITTTTTTTMTTSTTEGNGPGSGRKRDWIWIPPSLPHRDYNRRKGMEAETKANVEKINDGSDQARPAAPQNMKTMIIEPFPTMYWLTHPILRAVVSRLEISPEWNVRSMAARLGTIKEKEEEQQGGKKNESKKARIGKGGDVGNNEQCEQDDSSGVEIRRGVDDENGNDADATDDSKSTCRTTSDDAKACTSAAAAGDDDDVEGEENEIDADAAITPLQSMICAHTTYGTERWNLLTDHDQKAVSNRKWDDALGPKRGVGGIRWSSSDPSSIKCLHAHVAHYLAGGTHNVVGRWVVEEVCRVLGEKESEGKGKDE